MHAARRFVARLFETMRRNRCDDDAAREIASHLAFLEDEYGRRGFSEVDARFAARRALGSAALALDAHRDARSFAWIDDLRSTAHVDRLPVPHALARIGADLESLRPLRSGR